MVGKAAVALLNEGAAARPGGCASLALNGCTREEDGVVGAHALETVGDTEEQVRRVLK